MAIDTTEKKLSLMQMIGGFDAPGTLTIPEGAGFADEGDKLHVLSLYSGISVTGAEACTVVGPAFLYTAANWKSGIVFYFEAYLRKTSGTEVYAEIYDVDAADAVASSRVTSSSATFERLRSSAITLVDGNEYRCRICKVGSDAGEIKGAKIIAL